MIGADDETIPLLHRYRAHEISDTGADFHRRRPGHTRHGSWERNGLDRSKACMHRTPARAHCRLAALDFLMGAEDLLLTFRRKRRSSIRLTLPGPITPCRVLPAARWTQWPRADQRTIACCTTVSALTLAARKIAGIADADMTGRSWPKHALDTPREAVMQPDNRGHPRILSRNLTGQCRWAMSAWVSAYPVRFHPRPGASRTPTRHGSMVKPLKEDIEVAIGRPVRIANDANCFALV